MREDESWGLALQIMAVLSVLLLLGEVVLVVSMEGKTPRPAPSCRQ